MLTDMLKPDIEVENGAESGETIADSNGRGRFKKVLAEIKPGDFFIEQYAHNDMKSKAPNAAEKYKADLTEWVKQIKAKGATPIVVTPMNRHTFQDGKVYNSFNVYPDMVRQVAKEQNVALIDLTKMSATMYDAMGEQGSEQIFEHQTPEGRHDGTHQSPYGAFELARCIALGIEQNAPQVGGLADHLKPEFTKFDPAHPEPDSEANFHVPPSPRRSTVSPLGS